VKADSCKYSCALQVCEVLARISEGCERAHRAKCYRLVQIGSKAICDHAEQQCLMRANPSVHKSNAALENDLTSRWCCLANAKVLLDAAAHDDIDPRPCPLEQNFMVWLGEIRDAEYVSLVSFVMKKMKTGSHSSTFLADGIQR
jgi:hypothetical protein